MKFGTGPTWLLAIGLADDPKESVDWIASDGAEAARFVVLVDEGVAVDAVASLPTDGIAVSVSSM